MIIDHIGIGVSDFARSREFYGRVAETLNFEIVGEDDDWAMIGVGERPALWFGEYGEVQRPMHIAFTAGSRATVRAFHAAALEAGGTDNGAPGIREMYHPDYYGAFVLDPDGHNVEAVCHEPE